MSQHCRAVAGVYEYAAGLLREVEVLCPCIGELRQFLRHLFCPFVCLTFQERDFIFREVKHLNQQRPFQLGHLIEPEALQPLYEREEIHAVTLLTQIYSQFRQLLDGHALVQDVPGDTDDDEQQLTGAYIRPLIVEYLL